MAHYSAHNVPKLGPKLTQKNLIFIAKSTFLKVHFNITSHLRIIFPSHFKFFSLNFITIHAHYMPATSYAFA